MRASGKAKLERVACCDETVLLDAISRRDGRGRITAKAASYGPGSRLGCHHRYHGSMKPMMQAMRAVVRSIPSSCPVVGEVAIASIDHCGGRAQDYGESDARCR